MDDVLYLITQEVVQDEVGNQSYEDEKFEVFCEVEDVHSSQFYEAGRIGMHPDFVFVIFAGDYEGERLCEYNGQRYEIYRTYHREIDYLELYVQATVGVTEDVTNDD